MATWEAPPERRAAGRRLAAVTVALLLVAAAALALRGGTPPDSTLSVEDEAAPGTVPVPEAGPESEPQPVASGEPVSLAPGTWVEAADPPLTWIEPPVTGWTGRELLVWGVTADGTGAAAYDPVADAWRVLAAGPLSVRTGPAAVWAAGGDPREHPGAGELLVWGGRADDDPLLADGAAYDPRTDTWRALPGVPVQGTLRGDPPGGAAARDDPRAVWTGERMVVLIGGTSTLSYDPAADVWAALPPLGGGPLGDPVWTGREVVAVTTDGAVRQLTDDGWQDLPSVPVAVDADAHAIAIGVEFEERLVLLARPTPDDPRGSLHVLDVPARRWTQGPPAPRLPDAAEPLLELAGREVIVWAPVVAGVDGMVYDSGMRRWRILTGAPERIRARATGIAWTGQRLLVLGDGLAVFRPADAAPSPPRIDALVHIVSGTELRTVDVDRRAVVDRTDLDLPPVPADAPPADPGPVTLLRLGGDLAALRGGAAQRLPATAGGTTGPLGAATALLPATDTVWLIDGAADPPTAALLGADGTSGPALPLPPGEPVAALSDGIVLARGDGGVLVDPVTDEERMVATRAPLATGRRTLAWCVAFISPLGCATLSLSTPDQGSVPVEAPVPPGWAARLDGGLGRLSDDDAFLAVPLVARAATESGVALVDAATGETTVVPLGTGRPVRALGWVPGRALLAVVHNDVLLTVDATTGEVASTGIRVPDAMSLIVTPYPSSE